MARFGEINAQYFDDAGDPLGGGKLYFYESGTTTAKTTFADINLTIPNTNPVILTAAGRQPNIFFNGNAKGILTDKNNVQILVRDPIGETGTNFGDAWVATRIYSANAVVIGSDGVYYRSLANGNQNNNPTTTSGFWTLLYSIEWNAGITYSAGDIVLLGTTQFQSLQNNNLNKNPSSQPSFWVSLAFAWLSTQTYLIHQNVVGPDGILYTSLQNNNINKVPASNASFWVGTSAAAAASATAAAASAAAAVVAKDASVVAKNESVTAKNESVTAKDLSVTAKNESVAAKDLSVAAKDAAVVAKNAAATSATASASSATASAASFTSFDDRYLGAKSSAPTVDNNGDALIEGATYFNSTSSIMFVRSSGSWIVVAPTNTTTITINSADGGFANSVYTAPQSINGGTA